MWVHTSACVNCVCVGFVGNCMYTYVFLCKPPDLHVHVYTNIYTCKHQVQVYTVHV